MSARLAQHPKCDVKLNASAKRRCSSRFAAVALLSLVGVLGVGEAAHAQTVIWSATLVAEENDDGPQEGYGFADGYGSLSNTTFTHNGNSYSIVKLESSNGFTRMDFGGSEGHVERDIFGRSRSPNPVTLNIGSDSWMSSSSGTNFGGALILIFSEVIEAGNTYAVSITTTAPGAPQSLSATTVSSTEVKLSWSAPSSIGGSAVSGYKYRYKKNGAESFGSWTAIANSASLTEHTVGGLEENTGYTFQMLAANSSGDGLHSGEVMATTGRGTPTVTLVLDRDRISEDGGKSTVTATLDQASTAETMVTVSASAVSPAMSSHFALSTNKVLTIAAEATSSTGTVTIEAVNNAIDDDDRQVTVSATATNTAGITQPSSRTVTIFDDESESTKVTLSVSPTRVEEDATGADQTVTVTAELDGDPLLQATEVTIKVSDDTAIAGTHYTAVGDFKVMIAAGETSGSGTFTLAPIDDNLDRPDGTVSVTGTTTSGLSIAPESGVSVKILDDDDPPAVTLVLDPDAIDEDGGKSTVTATLDKASVNDIEITVSASPVAPAVADDFTLSTNKVLTIEAGDTASSGTVTITANNNDVGRGNQRVTVSGAAVSDNDGDLTPPGDVTLTITEDDAVPTTVTLTVSPSTVAEDATGSDRTVTVTAELDGARDEATPVAVSVTGGTAVAGTDYAAVDDFTVTIAARQTSGTATFTLAPIDDNVDERAETVVLTGTTAVSGLAVAPASGVTVTIADNDPRPQATLHLTPVQISENGGESTVTVTLDRPSSAVTTINVSHINISGTSGPGFRRTGSALTIAAGATQSTGTVKYTAVNNSVHTHDTALRVAASVANSVGVTPPEALVLTIFEDDTASTKVTLSASPVRVSEGGGDQTVTLTATLDEAARLSATPVRVSVSGGTAVEGTDFAAVDDFTFTIRSRQKSGTGTFTLSPVDNAVDGADKTVTVTATTPSSVGLPVQPDAGLTIAIEDDEGDPRLSLSLDAIATDNTVNIAEQAAGFSISGDTGSEAGVSVSVAVGSTTLTATSADVSGTAKWSVSVPANASYITGTSVGVTVSASKSGFTAPTDVTRTLAVDLVKPSVTYFAPSSLKVGAAVHVPPTTSDTDISSYSAVGLPSGLAINTSNGVISGTPTTVDADAASVTVTVTDAAGNPAEVSITFPMVAKADQTLTGFSYSSNSMTFGDSAPTLIAPMGAVGTLTYAATPRTVCTVNGTTGALTIVGAGTCEVTVTAASTDEYNEGTAKYTVTVNAAGTLSLSLDAIATDDTVNIAEKTAGFSISGDTGTEAGVSVSVAIGSTTLTATSADASGTATWSVSVPAEASYITGTSVSVRVSASKSGFTAATNVTRSLTVDLAAPAVTYTAPASLKVGAAVDVQPTTTDTDLASYSASGLPSGLSINATTGAITGEPDTVNEDTAEVTVTVTDTAGNPAEVSLTFPKVDKGDQTLTGFSYSSNSVTFGDAAPTLTAPDGAVGTLSYAAAPEEVCTVDGSSGALTIVGLGACVITVTAASTDSYNEGTATYTVTVTTAGQLVLNLDRITGDDTINVVEETSGFKISGDTGAEADVSVSVVVGTGTLTTTSADVSGTATWSVMVPGNAAYITGTSVTVTVSASKAGFTAPADVTRTLTVDLVAPTAPTYTVPGSLKLGSAITAMNPTGASGVDEYSAVGLPSGLSINASTGVISGTPNTINANTAFVIVRVSDEAGNIVSVTLTFPPVGKGEQTLTGFEYSSSSITFGDTAPTVTAPPDAVGTLSYTATPAEVCTVVEGTGALTIVGVGACEVTVTAASTDEYDEGTAKYTVTVNAAGTLSLSLDAIATDNTVNIAEKTAGFSISGDTGSEAGVSVSVAVGTTTLPATSADVAGTATWSVNVPAEASYITGTSVTVSVSASKTGYTAPTDVERTLAIDLAAPSVSYTAPSSLKVGSAVDVQPSTSDTDIASYSASGLPSGLSIHATTGAITGAPDTFDANTASVTVTVTDDAGNSVEVSLTFPAVVKGDQTLTGFAYSANTVTYGGTAPTLIAPTGAVGTLSYTATPNTVCTVDGTSGALTIVGVGTCEVTVTAASTDHYNEGTAKYTVTVNAAGTLSLNLDAIATDNTVNIAEKTAGFSISGDTGSETGVAVSVTIGSQSPLTATSADVSGTAEWSVNVPAEASYITGTSVGVTVSASKTGYTAPADVTRTLAIDLAVPSVTYSAPSSLKVGAAVDVQPSTSDTDIASYAASGLPSGLSIHATTGAITGAPDTFDANTASVTVTVTDDAGNSVEVSLTFPAVGKGDQTLTGFAYSANSVTFGDTAPTVTAPDGAVGTLSYAATPAEVCTVVEGTGALTIVGAGTCEVTVTAASTNKYNEGTAAYTVTVNAAGTLSLSLDAIATDNTVNIAEKTAGFSISGDTGSEAGVTVSVTIGSQSPLTATSADVSGTAAWSVAVPAAATYITGTSVSVSVTASKSGFTSPAAVTRSLTVDLVLPTAPGYTAPGSLTVGEAITALSPSEGSDIDAYSATGLPPGLVIDGTSGAISGTPTTAVTTTSTATVTVRDAAGNPATVDIVFPMVAKGEQSLTGFAYSASSITFGDAAPTVTAPPDAVGTLSYTATPEAVCTVDGTTGALTIVGAGDCVVTATAASTVNYKEATSAFTVTVQPAGTLSLNLDAIATDNTVNIAEKTAGFSISGDTGSEAGVSVSVAVGTTTLPATSADVAGTAEWSVSVPAEASYITGTSVSVTVSASKAGFTAPTDVTRTLAIDLAAPSVTYSAPSSLKVGAAVDVQPSTTDTDISSYSASGLPSGLSIHATTGAITGAPETVDANTASVTVTVTDTAGNPAEVSITFPAVVKGDQTLTGFEYSSNSLTFGDTAPTVTAPPAAVGTLSYTATPAEVCTVVEGTGALTIVGVGACEVTVTAASTDEYNEATAKYTVTVNAAGTLSLSLDAIATDNTVNIAEKTAGFSISGDTGSEAGVTVSVTIGSQSPLTATSADVSGTAAWSVNVPAEATYITGTSVSVTVSASKTGFTAPSAVTRTLAIDLVKPSVTYTVPSSLKVGAAVDVQPSTSDTDLASYSATGLPSGLSIHATTGAITGTPETVDADAASVTVTVTDNAGNPAEVTLTFPAVAKGDQSLAGFEYSSSSVTFGDTAPTVTAPPDAVGTLSYTATPAEVCTVVEGTGALTIVGAGACEVTVTAASTDKYNEGTAKYTVTVNAAGTLSLNVAAIATDNTVNIAEKTAGFSISGDTGSEAGVSVSVAVGMTTLTATSADVSGTATWSVSVPAEATYITGTSVTVSVSASKTGFTAPSAVERTLAIDLVKPSVSYSAPSSLKVGAAVDVQPTTTDTDIASYAATGLPSGLSISATTGAITGAPVTVDANTASVTVTVTDTAGNPVEVSVTFPMVDKGDQSLSGFEYSANSLTFGDTAPTVTAPPAAVGTLSYTATPAEVCTVVEGTGALTIVGVGACEVTVTAASTDEYNEGTAKYTVTVNAVGTLSLSLDAIATDNTVNIAEKTAGFSISGDTGSEAGVAVSVAVGMTTLTATSADVSGTATWSVSVPAEASYITGTSVSVTVSASKTGYTPPADVERTLAINLAAPAVTYTAPSSLKVGAAVDVRPSTTDTDISSYSASGLPSGLSIHATTGAITGAPVTVDANTASVTVTVTDTAGNSVEVSLTFPAVVKGEQTLTGFEYSANSITYGDTAPTLTAPDGAVGTLSYAATPAEVCTVVEGTGALTIVGVGECKVTVTAAGTDSYNEGTAMYTVTVNAAGTLSLSLDAIATDNTVNIAEKTAGFSISGDTGSEAGVSVSVAVGMTTLTATSADVAGTAEWSVSVPAEASYITGTSVSVTVSASKAGFTAPTDVTRTLAIDLAAPSVSYSAPSSLKVGAAVDLRPSTTDTDISSYSASGLPSGLSIDATTGAITGAPETVDANTASVTVTVTDTAGNPAEVSITFPMVGKGEQTLTGFEYSSSSITYGDTAPTLTAPDGAVGTLSYAATPAEVCTVVEGTGALTIVGAGTCEVTVTAASTDKYNEGTAEYTVTVNAAGTLSLNVDAIATDNTVNIAEKAAGFSISGDTGSEAGVAVSVTIGSQSPLTATSADVSGTAEWSVAVPAEATYITGTSVTVSVSASKTGYTPPADVERTLAIDLAAPSVTYTAPASLKVGTAVDVQPTTTDTDIASYAASGLPSGLSIHATTGAITGTPDTIDADAASVTVTVTDDAGNSVEVSVTFPMVGKGEQSLTGFEYSANSLTYGDTAPTLTAPDGAVGTLSYAATPAEVCTVVEGTGALTIVGAGTCEVTVTAASTDEYNEGTAKYTVTVNAAGTLSLNVAAIATDNTVNIAEKTAGFSISGDTGSEAGVSVEVAVGTTTLTATSADVAGTAEWSVAVPAEATYITGTSVTVSVSASKTGYTPPADVERTLAIDLVKPSVTYTAPASLKVGAAVDLRPSTTDTDISSYSASGLPSGLSINATTGAITGAPVTVDANTASVTVTVTDTAGNSVEVSLTFPAVVKGEQTLTGFEYSANSLTYGDTAPTLTAPDGAVGTLSYAATPAEVCTVVEGTGALTIVGVGTCEVTVTAASTDEYNEGTAKYTVTVNAVGTLSLNVAAIATDNTVNIAEKAAGFSISGDTGSEAGVSVSVAVGMTTLTATSADVSGTAEWSVSVPAAATYITGTSVTVSVSASKTGYTPPADVERTLAIDLVKPSVTYTAPSSLKVGAAVDVRPTTTDTDIASYAASGLPSGLSIHATTGAITGTPDTIDADAASVTVTVTDTAGNSVEVSVTFPMVGKGEQTLTGFEYSSSSVTFGDTAPTLTAPDGAVGTLSYAATPAEVCTVVEGTGALTIVGVGTCEITVTAASTDKYNEGTAAYTVTVNAAGTLSLNVAAIATDNTVNIAEKAAGFSISGDTGSEAGVSVSVAVGMTTLTATSADVSGTATWSVAVPAEASYITGTSVTVTVSASKTGYTPPADVERTLAIDLAAPSVSYTAPSTLKVGSAVDVQPSTSDTDISSYAASGLPSGLSIHATTGAITGTPDTIDADAVSVTVTVTDDAGNSVEVSLTFPAVQAAGKLSLHLNPIARDNTVNIAEKTAGFSITGGTGTEAGVTVSVTIGSTTLTATSADFSGTALWSVDVPAAATYITGTSVTVTVSASKTGFTAPRAVERTLTVDLVLPTAPSYTAPGSLTVGEAITALSPTGGSGIASYSATGLPPGLSINATTGAISGTPETADEDTAEATVTVSDAAGNPATVTITFPAVAKGEQTLTGFAYDPATVTYGGTAPTLTVPDGAVGALSYTATPNTVCTVTASTGALTLVGVGECEVTATAAGTDHYNEGTAEFTVTVEAAGQLVLNVDTIAGDDTVNIAEKTAGFSITGGTGTEAGVTVSVTIGSITLTATSADVSGTALWSVDVPAAATYITSTSVDVEVSASKTGFTAPRAVERTLTVDLVLPTAPSYTAPGSLKVGEAITALSPTGGSGIDAYSATRLPPGLSINATTGAISGTPETADEDTAEATVTVSDAAGNPATVTITFPAVAKGEQTLTGFAYSANTVTYGGTAPTLIAPSGAEGALSYTATPNTVCTVTASTGALTLVGVGECKVTATAAGTDHYNEGSAEFTVTVEAADNLVDLVDPPGKPRSMSLSSGNDKVILQWLPPRLTGTGPILRYEYRLDAEHFGNSWIPIPYSAPGEANHGRYEIACQNGEYADGIACQNGEYAVVYLRAVNSAGAGAEVHRSAMPFAGAPGPPGNFEVREISDRQFRLSWTEPAAGTGVTITGYIIEKSFDGVDWSTGGIYSIEVPGTTSIIGAFGIRPLYFRIRTQFRKSAPTVVDGTVFDTEMSEYSETIRVRAYEKDAGPGLPTVWVYDGYAREGQDGFLNFTVSLNPASTSTVTVDYRTKNLTAEAPGDYEATSGTLTFAPEETEKTVPVVVVDDNIEDSGEWFLLVLSNISGARLGREAAVGEIFNEEDVLGGFTLVDAASGRDVASLGDGSEVTLEDPANGRYGIVAGAVPDVEIGSVRLELSGAKTVVRTDGAAPYTLYAEGGEELPVGGYTLTATAYAEANGGGDALQTRTVSFTVTAATVAVQANTAATGLPTISGTAQVGETLSVSTANIGDADGLEDATFAYQWLRGGNDIRGATGTTYRLEDADEGERIKVRVSFTDDSGHEESLTSAATDAVDPVPVPLTASFEDMPAEHDGENAFTFRLRFSEEVGISYKTLQDESFSVTEGDVTGARRVDGRHDLWEITLEPDSREAVTITLNGDRECGTTGAVCTRGDDPRPLSNSPSATVAVLANTAATGLPTISGTAQVGETLSVSTANIGDADGLEDATFAYQWLRGGNDIRGATGTTYRLEDADEGERIKVRVSFTDDSGHEESLTSAATDAVSATVAVPANTAATGLPTISGTAQVGETLSVSTANIGDADGLEDATFAYQWLRGGNDIRGATGTTYRLEDADEGERIKVRVSFTDDSGHEESLTSAATDAVSATVAVPVPLTASFENMPATHDGSAFTFTLNFSENIKMSYVNMRDDVLSVSEGTIKQARRLNKPSNMSWEIRVKPSSNADVSIALSPTTNCAADGAVCTKGGKALSSSLSATVAGSSAKVVVSTEPPGLAPNAPNPFNASTLIPYRLATPGAVRLEIYNLLGQPMSTLVDQVQDAGAYQVSWDARDQRGAAVAAGVYIVCLHYPGGVQTQRLLYLK